MDSNEARSWEVEMAEESVPSLDALPRQILIQAAQDLDGRSS